MNYTFCIKRYFFALIIIYFTVGANAQVAVKNEPRHHNIFENDRVRVLNVFVAPNDTTQFHVHATPSVFISLSNTKTGSQLIGQKPVKNRSVTGSIGYDSLVVTRIHRVWNEDTTWYHVMDVELTGKPVADEPALQNSSLQLLYDKPLARIYTLKLTQNTKFQLPVTKVGYLLVSLRDADVTLQSGHTFQHQFMKAGHYRWIAAEEEFSITANNNLAGTFALLQLK